MLFAVAVAMLAGVGTPPPDAGAPKFSPGEELSYEVLVLGASAGTIKIDLGAPTPMDGVDTWPIVTVVQSKGAFDRLFSVRDRYVSWWDPSTRRAVAARITASEGSNRYGYFMHFHRAEPAADGGIQSETERWDGKKTETTSKPLDPQVEDFLAALYWLRTQPLAPKEVDTVPIFMGQTQWNLVAKVMGEQSVDVGGTQVPCIQVRLSAQFSGPLGNKRDLDAYFTKDPSHVPVWLESELFIGHMQAKLTSLPH